MSEWLRTPDEWTAFFEAWPAVVLVANSDAVRIEDLRAVHGDDALYVFFNKAYKVLDRPFGGRSLVVARSSPAGANIVYRHEVKDVLALFEGDALTGIAGMRVGENERFSAASQFAGARAGQLDLGAFFASFYPEGFLPTSGFALAVWLAETANVPVFLAGFTARRTRRWKLFADHDWTFEQVVLRLLARSGYLTMDTIDQRNPYAEIAARFPKVGLDGVTATGIEVLASRLDNANTAIDRLMSLTRTNARIDTFLRRLKPKTRKEKLAERN